MTGTILTVDTPLPLVEGRQPVEFETVMVDLDFDGVDERVEIDLSPSDEAFPFREWRAFKQGRDIPFHIGAGIDISIAPGQEGGGFVISDGAIWTASRFGGMHPHADILSERLKYLVKGTQSDQAMLDAAGAHGIFRDNTLVITADLIPGNGWYRIIAGAGFAFMDEETQTSIFVIRAPDGRNVLTGRSNAHPMIFRNGDDFTIVSKHANGYQISLVSKEVLL